MSSVIQTALQKWATARKTWVTITMQVDADVPSRSQAVLRCGLLGNVYYTQKKEEQTDQECRDCAATAFLEMFANSPLGRR